MNATISYLTPLLYYHETQVFTNTRPHSFISFISKYSQILEFFLHRYHYLQLTSNCPIPSDYLFPLPLGIGSEGPTLLPSTIWSPALQVHFRVPLPFASATLLYGHPSHAPSRNSSSLPSRPTTPPTSLTLSLNSSNEYPPQGPVAHPSIYSPSFFTSTSTYHLPSGPLLRHPLLDRTPSWSSFLGHKLDTGITQIFFYLVLR